MNKEKTVFLEGFKQGMEAGLKMAWAYANELLVLVSNEDKPFIRDYIKKLNH